jgi:ankyrin repeat protein
MLDTLISSGGDINRIDRKGATPLLLATISGNMSGIVLLLDHGADVNKKNKCSLFPSKTTERSNNSFLEQAFPLFIKQSKWEMWAASKHFLREKPM